MRLDIIRAGDKLAIDCGHPSGHQVGILKIAHPYRAIETLRDQINEAITIGGMDMKLGVLMCHICQYGSKIICAES